MKRLLALVFLAATSLHALDLTLTLPFDYQVVQRSTPGKGLLRIAGELSEAVALPDVAMEARVMGEKDQTSWQRVGGSVSGKKLSGAVEMPAGGWWRLEVRVSQGGKQLALGSVAHVGIGEVFVIAGQSNSANHGQEKQTTKTRRVASFDGKAWRIADDPQPGASGGGGSFVPAFADAVVAKENVPVGIIACGIGATSVREWLPKGATFPNPPTLVSRVEQLPNGQWTSKGAAYDAFIARMTSVPPQGFRAVLWHQGESDANQKDATRTLPGKLYREYLEKIIRDSRRDIGWDAPWFVAQASYHVPGDEGSDDIRAAQASLWKDGLALEGPDSDALKGKLRERDGQGVHFSGPGLREHGAKWAEKVLPWLATQWTEPRQTNDGTEWSDFAQLPECHSLGWVSANVQSKDTKSWNGVLDEAKWGTPDPQQVVSRNWDWKVSDEQWREAVKQKGEGKREEVAFDFWLPEGIESVKGSGHPELEHAPLFLYGHSNGTGFSAIFASYEPQRVWGFVSMRPGTTFQVYQPGAAHVPGIVIFGEDDPFLARPSKEENLAVVPALRKNHRALWNIAVEPKTGHGPGEKTWPLVFSFLRHSFTARVPADADARKGPVKLLTPALESGHLGQNWQTKPGGYQKLITAPFTDFPADKATASWLLNAAYAADWQAFQRDGAIAHPK